MKKITLAAAALLVSISGMAAELENGLAECALLTADPDRLKCYDALSAAIDQHSPDALAVTEMSDDIGRKREREKKQKKALAENYQVNVTACERGTASKRMSFKLENGQVWRQKNSRWLSLRDCEGPGTLKNGYFGYSLHLEAMNKSIAVIRAD